MQSIFLSFFENLAEKKFLAALPDPDVLTRVIESAPTGRSVIANCPIPAGTLLGIYPGKKILKSEFYEKEDFTARSMVYAYYLSEDTVIDPTDMFGYLSNSPHQRLALINEPPLGYQVNVIPINSQKHVWYLTLKNISSGEQLFTTYGTSYMRNYSSEMTTSSGEIILNREDILVLEEAAINYPWLKAGIEMQKL